MLLSELPVGRRGVVRRVLGDPGIRRRLLSMGFVPGTEVETLRVAPMGDPLAFEVKGYDLSLRKEEAAFVEVEPAAETSLLEAPAAVPLLVTHVHAGWGMRRRLRGLGIGPGTRLVRCAGGRAGPVDVELDGDSVRLGRGMAMRIFVRPEQEPA